MRAFGVIAFAATAIALGVDEIDAVNDPVQQARRGELTALSEHSMVRRENLSRAVREARERAGPEALLETLTLRPTEAEFDVLTSKGEREITVDPGFGVEDKLTQGVTDGVEFDRLDTAAPERMVTEVRRRFRQRPEDLSFLVITATFGFRWQASYRAASETEHRYDGSHDGTGARLIYTPQLEAQRKLSQAREREDE